MNETQRLHITDLTEPVLTPAQADALRLAEQAPIDLSAEAVLDAAVQQARLDDFGSDDFRERLELLVSEAAWEGHTKLTQAGLMYQLTNKAVDRLLTVDLLRRHPEIRREEIKAPVIVAGLPRSGTTHLLNLIAADSRFQSMPFWEVLRPVPLLPEDARTEAHPNPRWERAQAGWERAQQLNPYLISVHPLDPDHISEDGELQMADFASYAWEFFMRAPHWRDYYFQQDQTPHYEYEKLMLQVLQWQQGERRRWIVKSPQHFEQLRPIMNVFPDAVVVFTHRDPVASLQSIVTMRTYTGRIREKRIDRDDDLKYWTERYGNLVDSYLRDISLVPPDQQFDCVFREFMQDDVAMVERIYQTLGMPMTDTARGELEAYMAGHHRGAHGQVVFDLRTDFGVEPAMVRERFAEYVERIPVGVEAR
jgi:hypothetical protein